MQKPSILASFVLAAFATQTAASYNAFPELAYGSGAQGLVATGQYVAGSAVRPMRPREGGSMSRVKVRMILEGRQTVPTCEAGYTYFPECAADGEGGCCANTGRCCVMGDDDWCCDNTHDCYRSSTDGKASCCLKGAESCNAGLCVVAGSLCCPAPAIPGGKVYACAATAVCNSNQGANCCSKSQVLCPNACCPAGTTCPVGKPGTCGTTTSSTNLPTSTTTTTRPTISTTSTTRSTTSTTSTTSNTFLSSSTTRTASSPTNTGVILSCSIGGELRSAKRDALPEDHELLEKRQNGGKGYWCSEGGETLPVVQFDYEAGVTDELIPALCAGIKRRSKRGNEAILTWADDDKIGLRRRASGCVGLCKGKVTEGGDVSSCNQFPFASTLEGGAGASLSCISSFQNTIQGIYIASWAALYGLRANDKFVVRVAGYDCDTGTVKPNSGLVKRQIGAKAVDPPIDYSTAGTSEKVVPGLAAQVGSGMGYAIVPIGDIDPGMYEVELDFSVSSSQVSKISVVNSEGWENANTNSKNPITEKVYAFEAADVDFGLAVVVQTSLKTLKVSYKLSGKVQPAKNTPRNEGADVKTPHMAGLVMAIGGVAALML